jgi:hypothetical protein
MRSLVVVAGLFFMLCGAFIMYFAASDPGREFDLKFVLPIDARQMPKPVAPPAVVSRSGESEPSAPIEGRAEAGSSLSMPDRPLIQFGDRPGSASEAPSRD